MSKCSPDPPETFDNPLTPLDELVVEYFPAESEVEEQIDLDYDFPYEDTDQS